MVKLSSSMRKAFLFDMDGVLADTETLWDKLGHDRLLENYFGRELFEKVTINKGTAIKKTFDAFVQKGWKGSYEEFNELHTKMALEIYPKASLSPGLEDLIDTLVKCGFLVGIVSSSPIEWIELLISRLRNRDQLSLVLSVNTHKTLHPKPSPDPYLYAMKKLGVKADKTIILEDSKTGVTAGKASGAKVICFTAYHQGYDKQVLVDNADHYTDSMRGVLDIVAKIDQ